MGNCNCDQVHHAISLDGEQNVKNVAILTANQAFVDQMISQMKPKIQKQLQKNLQFKQSQITESKKIIDQMLSNKKLQFQTKETGSMQYFEKHRKAFENLSGYARAVSKLQDFQRRNMQIYNAESRKLIEDMQKYKQDLIFQLEKLKQPLPSLMSFGLEQKNNILMEVAKQQHKQVEKSNKKLEEQINSEFKFEQLHQKRIEQWVPSSELNDIMEEFEKSLNQMKLDKSNFFSCY